MRLFLQIHISFIIVYVRYNLLNNEDGDAGQRYVRWHLASLIASPIVTNVVEWTTIARPPAYFYTHLSVEVRMDAESDQHC